MQLLKIKPNDMWCLGVAQNAITLGCRSCVLLYFKHFQFRLCHGRSTTQFTAHIVKCGISDFQSSTCVHFHKKTLWLISLFWTLTVSSKHEWWTWLTPGPIGIADKWDALKTFGNKSASVISMFVEDSKPISLILMLALSKPRMQGNICP